MNPNAIDNTQMPRSKYFIDATGKHSMADIEAEHQEGLSRKIAKEDANKTAYQIS